MGRLCEKFESSIDAGALVVNRWVHFYVFFLQVSSASLAADDAAAQPVCQVRGVHADADRCLPDDISHTVVYHQEPYRAGDPLRPPQRYPDYQLRSALVPGAHHRYRSQ